MATTALSCLQSGLFKPQWFGTDGLRAAVNTPPITPQCLQLLGQALAQLIKRGDVQQLQPAGCKPQVVIGWDTRASGPDLTAALSEGLGSCGVAAVLLGVVPTAAVGHLVQSRGACAGLVVSASHNPASDNGIKMLDNQGYKFSQQLEQLLYRQLQHMPQPLPGDDGCAPCSWQHNAADVYIQRISRLFAAGPWLKGLRIAVDCAQGAAYKIGPQLLQQLGAQVMVLADQPNGQNINDSCGSEYPSKLQQFVHKHAVDFAVALDGDADRCAFVDEKGQLLEGDAVLMLLAKDLKQQGKLPHNGCVATVMSDMALKQQLQAVGIALQHTPVGDRHVVQRLQQQQLALGGEPSGHIVFWPHSHTADGLLATLLMASLLQRADQPLSELARQFEPTPRVLLNVSVPYKVALTQLPKTQQLVAQIKRALGDTGRILVRYSGTQLKARILLEGRDAYRLQQLAHQVSACWQWELQYTDAAAAKQET